jgi:hypothetical protein
MILSKAGKQTMRYRAATPTLLILTTVLAFCLSAQAKEKNQDSAPLTLILPASPKIQYGGRWNRTATAQPTATWQGCSVTLRFKGTSIIAQIGVNQPTDFEVIIDGVLQNAVSATPSQREIHLAKDLDNKPHAIQLMLARRSRKPVVFQGFKINGAVLPPPPRANLRIEFFGDSNMAGDSNFHERNKGKQGTYYAFPAMLCRLLNAEMNNQAVSGAKLRGIIKQLYSDGTTKPDRDYRSGFDPHIIVVNAGANDVPATREVLKSRYKQVLDSLRTVYGPKPHIVFFNAYGWNTREPANYTRQFVKDFKDPNLSVCLFPWLLEHWHGCMTDHSGQTHLLADHLKSINPTWAAKNPNDIFDAFGRNGDLANGSFEHRSPFGGFGWRYFTDGVQRVNDPGNAADGTHYIRLKAGQKIHQPADATADFKPGGTVGKVSYTVSAKVRGVTPIAKAEIIADFQGQKYRTRKHPQSKTLTLTSDWQDFTTRVTAPEGTWTVFITLKAAVGTVEFDKVRMKTNPEEVKNVREPKTLVK